MKNKLVKILTTLFCILTLASALVIAPSAASFYANNLTFLMGYCYTDSFDFSYYGDTSISMTISSDNRMQCSFPVPSTLDVDSVSEEHFFFNKISIIATEDVYDDYCSRTIAFWIDDAYYYRIIHNHVYSDGSNNLTVYANSSNGVVWDSRRLTVGLWIDLTSVSSFDVVTTSTETIDFAEFSARFFYPQLIRKPLYYSNGYEDGETDGYSNGFEDGWIIGDQEGNIAGYNSGYAAGYTDGETDGYSLGHDEGYDYGFADGEQEGVAVGRTDALNAKDTFKDIVFAIFDAPVNLINGILDFNLLGINVASLVKTLITLAITALLVFFILKLVKG